ncbi:MAG: tetratricopeptide repeat protein [Fimbriimonadales bacterium]
MATVQDNQQPIAIEEIYEAGFTARCAGDYDTAKSHLTRVLQLDPTHMRARWQLALIKGFEGDFDGSLEDLRVLSRAVPGNTDIRYDYGMTLMMLGDYDAAKVEFEAILSLEPDNERAQQQMAYFG